jgi:hypothetical protein
MAWIKERITDDGDKRFVACYRDPEGRQRSAGTYSSRRAAERAANREEAKVREGAWHDHSRGVVTFAEYVQTVWLPSKQVETSTLAPTGPTSTSTSSPPSAAGRWARSSPPTTPASGNTGAGQASTWRRSCGSSTMGCMIARDEAEVSVPVWLVLAAGLRAARVRRWRLMRGGSPAWSGVLDSDILLQR